MTRFIALSLLVYTACASSEAGTTSPAPAKAQPAASPVASMQDLCVQSFTHNRQCSDLYIPALVDTRAKIDRPPGIAERVKTDRDGVIAKAREEWAEDSKDENIASHCQQMTGQMNPDDPRIQALAEQVRACQPMTDCAAYVPCIEKVEEQLMSMPHP